jgi:hypothetical protein
MIRAVKTIEKDEEILVSYKSNKVPGTYLNRVGFVPGTKIMCIKAIVLRSESSSFPQVSRFFFSCGRYASNIAQPRYEFDVCK